MKSVAVFCGANFGNNPIYKIRAQELGKLLAEQNIQLVFGGGRVGLMGTIADSVLQHGGKVTGVIPQSLVDREVAHASLTELHVVQTMHERKALMASLADGFIAMPGGFGTLDEVCEIITWNQLGIITKPVAFYNVNNYFNSFMQFIERSVADGFIREEYQANLIVQAEPVKLLQQLTEASNVLSKSL
ncbi:LOG family protein [Adhaeribacter pallidiroseus]|uniref:Cytokinin riboside 5'-monophosphate phosphoribohydrolase n=1 Tax=Adhaeribacter pallidiroseus TaxID=2072847 RepID=A0A369QPP9_9BACT|nr:TIGR00730 family Rossman fold protein [Adhaeribacter pallidiroseus]RDC66292.1 Cytokinin riboside 5'-monophosphate phosphoribohydrolase [Adhaeribacter pallidiroseus]